MKDKIIQTVYRRRVIAATVFAIISTLLGLWPIIFFSY